jgi:hypothetical protein
MNGDEKSDPTIVAMKPANEPLRRGKEWAEPRVGAEGNVRDPHEVRAQDRAASSTGIDRVREVAREKKGERFTTLLHHIDATLLRQAYFWLKRDAAPGVDGMTWDAYGEGLEARLRDLESRIHLGSYRAQACVPTSQNLTAGNGRWGLRRWKIRSSNAPWLKFSMRSTSRTSSASPMGSGLDGDSTMRWTRSRWASGAGR